MALKKHIAGIVPVSGLNSDFNMPWHESLMPIGPNYLAVERAVAECAYAGCDSIWIVCGDNVSPLIRYQVGEKIQDPVYNYRHFEFDKGGVKKPIRVYYVPIAITWILLVKLALSRYTKPETIRDKCPVCGDVINDNEFAGHMQNKHSTE